MLKRRPKRAPGESPALRKHFIHELLAHEHAGDLPPFLATLAAALPFRIVHPDLTDLMSDPDTLTTFGRDFFRSWLRHHGIDPDTGKMTIAGYEFFRAALDQDAAA